MMMWLIGIAAFAIGIAIGIVSAGKLGRTDPARIRELERQLDALQRRHDSYRSSVSEHFSTTAELVQNMTESYRDVYQHLAGGAQNLCSEEVAGKMLPGRDQSLFEEGEKQDSARSSDGADGNSANRGRREEDSGNGVRGENRAQASEQADEPPKDYAPRWEPRRPGALSEDFGLDKTDRKAEHND